MLPPYLLTSDWRRVLTLASVICTLAFSLRAAEEPVRVVVSDEVAVANVKRFGMNLNDSWWDAGAVTTNRAVYNFEGTQYRSIFWGPAQDAQGIYVWQSVTAPPEDYGARGRVVGADFTILNGPAKGRTGKIVEVRRQALPDNPSREVDYLVFDQEVPASDAKEAAVMVERNGLDEGHYNVVGAGRPGSPYWLSADAELVTGDVAPESFGNHALKLDGAAESSHIRLPGKKNRCGRGAGQVVAEPAGQSAFGPSGPAGDRARSGGVSAGFGVGDVSSGVYRAGCLRRASDGTA